MAENTFCFTLGEEKDTEVEIKCALFLGDYGAVIGMLPWKDREIGVFKLFFVDFLITHVVVVIRLSNVLKKINKK